MTKFARLPGVEFWRRELDRLDTLESIDMQHAIAIHTEQVRFQVIEAPVFKGSRRLQQSVFDSNSKNVRTRQRCRKVQVQRDVRVDLL